ncbi:LysR family transcriptional regulator [Neptuniibacter halophilus]|uniref:LysR family transcriptional regulator n=1 Tax=Neptuniibacter halophilus TaxID=651666 RepID=UPI0025733CD5|nr:LysR family transcriptional regulator [Neptuniibacter halophilus]
MNKLKAMSIFLRIIDCGSLSQAADKLGLSQSSVARSLAALERELGVQLIHRTTRRLQLTEEGYEYSQRCRQILLEIEDAESALTQRQSSPRGVLKITAPQTFGRRHLSPLINLFLEEFPSMQVELVLLDRVVDLLEEGMDIALRIGQLPDSSLIAKQVGELRNMVCASPELLNRSGTPEQPDALESLNCIQLTAIRNQRQWSFKEGSQLKRIQVSGRFRTNHVETALDACIEGLGFGQFLSYQVAPAISRGDLISVLHKYERPPLPVSLVYPHSRLLSSRSKVFIDWVTPRLKARLLQIEAQLSGQ